MTGCVRATALACGLVVLSEAVCLAQQPADLVTDRPDATESAVTVPPKAMQMEFGARWIFDRSADGQLDIVEAPGTLVRVGVSQRVELRLGWGGWIETALESSRERHRVDGFADPEVGMKWALMQPGGMELALLAHVTLPAGDEIVGAPGIDPSVRLAAAHPIGDRASLGWNLGYEIGSFDGGGHTETVSLGRWVYSGTMGVDITPRWGGFVEIFGDLPASDPGPAVHVFDGGVTYLVAPRVQLDLSGGVGLNDVAPDRFVGVGLSLRVPR